MTAAHNCQQLSETERGAIQVVHENHCAIREIASRPHQDSRKISHQLKRGLCAI
ncbi:hypothetical protein [Secundilactobacillus folii]|uniref:hypothetical protein n=1 Tax=Secundilactobacillus folii TaxID=2678357 RepID=UPI003CCE0809